MLRPKLAGRESELNRRSLGTIFYCAHPFLLTPPSPHTPTPRPPASHPGGLVVLRHRLVPIGNRRVVAGAVHRRHALQLGRIHVLCLTREKTDEVHAARRTSVPLSTEMDEHPIELPRHVILLRPIAQILAQTSRAMRIRQSEVEQQPMPESLIALPATDRAVPEYRRKALQNTPPFGESDPVGPT